MTRRSELLIRVALVLLTGCAGPSDVQEIPTLEIKVGVHEVSLRVPAGWEHLDYGRAHEFRKDMEIIKLEDLGRGIGHLDPLPPKVLEDLGYDERRSIARSSLQTSRGLQILVIDTWDRLSHAQPRRFGFLLNEGSLLALHTKFGDFAAMSADFDSLLASLAIKAPEEPRPLE